MPVNSPLRHVTKFLIVVISVFIVELGECNTSQNGNSFGLSSSSFEPSLLSFQIRNASSSSALNHPDALGICSSLNLTARQNQICLQGDGIPGTLLDAAGLSASFCQQEFRYERWTCNTFDPYRKDLLHKVYRETAVLFAFSAAGLQHTISRACSAGRLKKCFCAESKNSVETRQTWKWGGCGDNVAYGRSFTSKFLDTGQNVGDEEGSVKDKEMIKAKTKKKNFKLKGGKPSAPLSAVSGSHPRWRRTNSAHVVNTVPRKHKFKKKKVMEDMARLMLDRHNNRVGMQVVEDLVRRICKCHGVSGSCTVQTCWNQLAAFGETASALKSKYDSPIRVTPTLNENFSNARHATKVPSSLPENSKTVRDSTAVENLHYVEESPNFCTKSDLGPGTAKRTCLSEDNCDHLCCGRGFNVRKSLIRNPCNCKLIFCCKVECSTCLVEKQTLTCK